MDVRIEREGTGVVVQTDQWSMWVPGYIAVEDLMLMIEAQEFRAAQDPSARSLTSRLREVE
jgi:hypothetical protein